MDLTAVRPVFDALGPFLTLHLEVGRTDEDGVEQQEARWTRVRHDLEHHAFPADVLERIGELVRENTHQPGEVRRTVVATETGVLFDSVQPGHSHRAETVDHGDLPDLSGWLTQEDQAVPFVLVVADRTGADLEVHRAATGRAVERREVTGETFYITKVAEGDWAQKQFQQTAENAWHQNAQLVADEVASLVGRHRPQAVLVAGEVRARSEVVKALSGEGVVDVPVLEVESGGRAAGASEEALWAEVREKVTEVARSADADVAAALDEARGRGEGAATGLDEVLDALAKAQVERLVLDLDALEDKVVEPGRHPGLVLPEPALSSGREVPAARALVAAAALTGARLTLLPEEMGRGGGASALLRWSDNAPAEPTGSV
jgi:hypothetical protein